MNLPVTVIFGGMQASPALRTDIEEHAQRLLRFAPRLQTYSVTVSRGEHRHRKGNRYRVHVSAGLPGRTFDAGCSINGERDHENVYVAVHDAFDALRRQLEDFVRIRRGDIKTHHSDSTPP